MNIIKYCNRIIEYSFYTIFFLVPLVFTGATSELFEFNKMWLTFGMTAIIAAAWGAKMVVEKRFFVQRTPMDIPILLFLASQIISTVISLDPHVSWWGYYSRFNGGLLSTICYILLYYAFATNLLSNAHDVKAKLSKPIYFSALGVLAVAALITLGIGGQDEAGVNGRAFFIGLALITALVLFIWSYKASPIYKLLFITLNAGLLAAAWGFPAHFGTDPTCQLFRGTFDTTCWTEQFQPTVRTFSTLGQPAWFAAYLALLIPLAMAFALKQTSARVWVFIGLAIFFYINLLFANTRAGIIAFWVANAVFWAVIYFRKLFPKENFIRAFAFFNIAFILCTFFIGAPIGPLSKFTLPVITNQNVPAEEQTPSGATPPAAAPLPGNQGITDSANIRLYVWEGAVNAWKSSPLFGTGVETFAFAYYKFKPVGHNLTSEWDYLYNKAHNEYLNYLTTTGLFGLGSYLAIIVMLFFITGKHIYKQHKKHEQQHDGMITTAVVSELMIIALIAGFITILITNFFGFSVVIMNLYLFLIPVFIFILGGLIKENHAFKYSFGAEHEPHKHQSLNPFQWTLITTFIVIAGWQIISLMTFHQADIAYALGSNLDKTGNFQQAYPQLVQAVETKPGEPVFKDELSINLAAISAGLYSQNDKENANKLAQEAIKFSTDVVNNHPNNVVYWKNRVRLYYTLSATDQANAQQYLTEALRSINKAKELAPTDAKVAYNQGILYGQTGNLDRAIAILEETIKLKPDYRDAYVALGLFYHQSGVDENNKVTNPDRVQKAIATYQTVLDKLNPGDEEVKKSLDEWKQL